jgi:hypothetical protein
MTDAVNIREDAALIRATLELSEAILVKRCNGCGLPTNRWGPTCPGMTTGDATHYHSPEWWAQRAERAALAAAGETAPPGALADKEMRRDH